MTAPYQGGEKEANCSSPSSEIFNFSIEVNHVSVYSTVVLPLPPHTVGPGHLINGKMMDMKLVDLSAKIGRLLREHRKTVATAESCTGGLIGHLITEVPGSSTYFRGGIIAYSNEVKEGVLGVSPQTLATVGAVSAACAAEMAQGARRLLGTDIAVSVTGIAGPTGGTPEKPVGLTYIHLSAPDCEFGERHIWQGTRSENKRASARAALLLIQRYLTDQLPRTSSE